MKHDFAQTLQKGDLIVVPYTGRNVLAIYVGEGRIGNIHFYSLSGWNDDNSKNWFRKRLGSGKTLRKDYINRMETNVIAKVHEEDIRPEIKAWYNELKFLLHQNGKL